MKRSLSLLLIAALIIAMPHSSFAWGKEGHHIVAEIAFTYLDSKTKATVQKYLGATTIEQASTWMDDVRGNHELDYMKPWHYVNIEKGRQYSETKDGNIINALNNTIKELEHRDKLSDEDIRKDLMIIIHLTGDLHMPLHVGYEEDKGGNTVHVNYLGHKSNLHKVWDSEIIESEGITANDCMVQLKNLNKGTIDAYKKINVENWVTEPCSALATVYDFNDNTIDQAYIDKNKKVVEMQLGSSQIVGGLSCYA